MLFYNANIHACQGTIGENERKITDTILGFAGTKTKLKSMLVNFNIVATVFSCNYIDLYTWRLEM
jgi:hypothetical protein